MSLEQAVSAMTDEIVAILRGNVYGIWLYGSVVMDDFRLGWSDIDFVALTDSEISVDQADRLVMLRQKMQEREPATPYFRSFEGIIANRQEYCDRAFQRLVYWGTSGQRVTDSYTMDAFARYELAVCSRSVCGEVSWPFPEPAKEELVQGVLAHYETIRKYAVQTDGRLYSCGWLLDIARCIYTLRYGKVISKTAAGLWALDNHIFPEEAALGKTIMIRKNPSVYREDPDTQKWLSGLGPTVQKYADVLEKELQKANEAALM
ncbi:MAG: nucleotidyltransferase domain-containing protein [Lachnospiraceae bacterium]|nr:nucleotidyltransferase domain-containing protein [Lachnospiraceae bacterium]